MKSVGIRELKNHLSEYIRLVRQGEEIYVTDRGEVVAELRQPGQYSAESPYPELLRLARQGKLRLGAPNYPDVYPRLEAVLPIDEAAKLLDEERGER
jgi:hypothetical protein